MLRNEYDIVSRAVSAAPTQKYKTALTKMVAARRDSDALHGLPKRFVRIRHYGLMAGRNVATKLACCRQLLTGAAEVSSSPTKTWIDRFRDWTGEDPFCCPRCQGPLQRRVLDEDEYS
jgi:hypothetical protein